MTLVRYLKNDILALAERLQKRGAIQARIDNGQNATDLLVASKILKIVADVLDARGTESKST